MDLDRIRAACDLAESRVRLMAKRRAARTRRTRKPRPRLIAAALAGAVFAVAVALWVLVVSHNQSRSMMPSIEGTDISAAGPADTGVELVRVETVLDEMRHAKVITLAAFSLRSGSEIVRSLEAAAARGSRVSVVLARGFAMYSRKNSNIARELAKHGVRVHLVDVSQRSTHIKAAILDGRVYLSDRNWTSGSADAIVIRDSIPGDRVLVERSFIGQSGGNDHLWTRKGDALAAEAGVLAAAHSHHVRISSESFGMGTPVYSQLIKRRKAGDGVSLLIARSEYVHARTEKEAVAHLAAAGVEIRLSSTNEKMVIDGATVWIGSANATAGLPDQLEFGIVMTRRSIAEQLQLQFDREWEKAGAAY